MFYVSDGSEAVEAALKLARQYFVERGEPQRCWRRRSLWITAADTIVERLGEAIDAATAKTS